MQSLTDTVAKHTLFDRDSDEGGKRNNWIKLSISSSLANSQNIAKALYSV